MSFPQIVLLAAAVFVTACQPAAVPSPTAPSASADQPPLLQWSGQHGGAETLTARPLRTADAWNAFWREVGREPPRPLDVPGEMAVALFLGERSTGGFSVEIVATRIENGNLVVEYREHRPPPDAFVTQALTRPWAVAIVPSSDLPVVAHAAR